MATPCVVVSTFRVVVSTTLRVAVVRHGTLFGIPALVVVMIRTWERSRLLTPRESSSSSAAAAATVPIESREASCRRRCMVVFRFSLMTDHGVEGQTKGYYEEDRRIIHSYDRHRRLAWLAWSNAWSLFGTREEVVDDSVWRYQRDENDPVQK